MQKKELLVDVADKHKTLHTFPVTLKDEAPAKPSPPDTAYKEKALTAAAHAQLVPNEKLGELHAEIHVERKGPAAPYGDGRHILTETKPGLEQDVRERAYRLWQQEGCLDGRAEHDWHLAHDQQTRERAYAMWQREGLPEGGADEHWRFIREFEAD